MLGAVCVADYLMYSENFIIELNYKVVRLDNYVVLWIVLNWTTDWP
jgi:hypothetical protein